MGVAPGWSWVLAVAVAIVPGGRGLAQGGVFSSEAGHFMVTFESELDPLEINRMHNWVIHIETANRTPVEDADLTLEGGMPAHDHGLPSQPRVTRHLGHGDYLVEGVRFHMSGDWEITVTITAGDVRDTCVILLSV